MKDSFEHFAWHVPKAFGAPLLHCQLEEGDLLFSNASCSESGHPALNTDSIQFLTPKRGTTIVDDGKSGGVFESNWNGECTIELVRWSAIPERSTVNTTQGRVYTCLWKGDQGVLSLDTPNPVPPRLLKTAAKQLRYFGKTGDLSTINVPLEVKHCETIFAMGVDEASAVSEKKVADLYGSLKSKIQVDLVRVTADFFFKTSGFSPTIFISLIVSNEDAEQLIHDTVKRLFYRPDQTAKKSMFSIRKHGIFIKANQMEIG